jgi:hypothetical protein
MLVYIGDTATINLSTTTSIPESPTKPIILLSEAFKDK